MSHHIDYYGNSMDSSAVIEAEMTSQSAEIPSSPGLRQRGDNKEHLFNHMTDPIVPHLLDHDYACGPIVPHIAGVNHIGPPTYTFTDNPVQYVEESLPSELYPTEPHPTEQPPTEPPPIIQAVYNVIHKDRVVYGTKDAMVNLMDYVGQVQQVQTKHKHINFTEGVVLSRVLQIQANSTYNEQTSYARCSRLGEGTFGSVWCCVDRTVGTKFACKRVSMSAFRRQEVEALVQLHDKTESALCLPEIYGVVLEGDMINIFMEFVDMTWLHFVGEHKRQNRALKESVVVDLLRQALMGLRHLQRHRICHCDIKPDNLGYNCHGNVKILDFGTVRLPTEEFSHRGMTGHYMSPEACRRIRHYNSDTWSLACSVLYLINGKHPWTHVSARDQMQVVRAITTAPNEIFIYLRFAVVERGISRIFADLLEKMFHPNPDVRINAEAALQHPVFVVTSQSGGTVNSLGHIGQEVPAVVPSQASDSRSNPGHQTLVQQAPVGHQTLVQAPVGHQTLVQAPVGHQMLVQAPVGQQTLVQAPVGHQTLVQAPVGHQTLVQQAPVGHQMLVQQAPVGHQMLVQQAPVGHQTLVQEPVGHQTLVQQAPVGHQMLVQQAAVGHQTLVQQAPVGHQTLVQQAPVGHQRLVQQAPVGHQMLVQAPVGHQTLVQAPVGHQTLVQQQAHQLTTGAHYQPRTVYTGRQHYDEPDSVRSSVELDLKFIPGGQSGNKPANLQMTPQMADSSSYLQISPQVAESSGYNSTNQDVSVEVIYKDRVDQFRAPQNFTFGDIWPTLREKAQRLTSGSRTAIAFYEDTRKMDTSAFNEVLLRDRRFTLIAITER